MSLTKNMPFSLVLSAPPEKGARILILDNDEQVLVDLERVLEGEGYSTETAIDYSQASALLLQQRFDLLVLDDHLSDRDCVQSVVDFQCANLIPPFVVVTYHCRPSQGLRARLWVLGVNTLINKHAHGELTQTVRAMINPRDLLSRQSLFA